MHDICSLNGVSLHPVVEYGAAVTPGTPLVASRPAVDDASWAADRRPAMRGTRQAPGVIRKTSVVDRCGGHGVSPVRLARMVDACLEASVHQHPRTVRLAIVPEQDVTITLRRAYAGRHLADRR